jgi:hypothetical protein
MVVKGHLYGGAKDTFMVVKNFLLTSKKSYNNIGHYNKVSSVF